MSAPNMNEHLASWTEGPARAAIVGFVDGVTAEGGRGKGRPALRLLVDHDDGELEFRYTGGAEQALDAARAEGWTVVSVKDDWATVFADHPR